MATTTHTRPALRPLLAIAAAVFLLHTLTDNQYGFHRDELQFLSDARHLDWGFIAYPPLTPLLERLGLHLFGVSLVGLRLFSVIAQSLAVLLTGLMAFELGGAAKAQIAAALSVALAPLPLFEATEFQYSSFDFLWWVLAAYFTIRLLQSGNPRWWLAIAAALGLGLQTKYTIVFFIAGLLTGLLLTPARRFLRTPWFWAGVALALAIFLPNLLWQIHRHFISIAFLHHIHVRDVRQGRGDGFLKDQFLICTNLITAPLWIAGAFAFFRSPGLRMLGWMYLVPVAFFFLNHGRGYYTAAAYPMVLAMGAVVAERWLSTLIPLRRRIVEATWFTLFAACGALFAVILVPIFRSGPIRDFALKINGDLREEFGWNEMVQTVAAIRDSLPPEQQQHLGIFTGNYGEQGAIEILGAPYRLPPPISLTNSAWLRGYPTPQPSTLIVLGFDHDEADATFTGCRLAGHNGNTQGVKNEESEDHPDIFVCGPLRQPWPDFWRTHQRYG